MAAWAAAASRVALVVPQEALQALVVGRFTSPTFVPHMLLLTETGRLANTDF